MRTDDEIIHGMITSEPYAFNDSYPTALIQDRRGTGKRKTGRRKYVESWHFQESHFKQLLEQTNYYWFLSILFYCRFHVSNLEPYVSASELLPVKYTLEPPEGFTDTLGKGKLGANIQETVDVGGGGGLKGKSQRSQQANNKNSNEYAIAVWDML